MDHTSRTGDASASEKRAARHLRVVPDPAVAEPATAASEEAPRRMAPRTIGRLIAQTALLADTGRRSGESAPPRRPRSARFGWFL